jgi:hypothetical protein
MDIPLERRIVVTGSLRRPIDVPRLAAVEFTHIVNWLVDRIMIKGVNPQRDY